MQYAYDEHRTRVEAVKNLRAWCPCCGVEVLAKCGQIIVHHWAHKADLDCDCWYEPETEWHRGWKALANPERIEVVCGEHRADIKTARGQVVELQNSAISPGEIAEREAYYRNMIWLVNASHFLDRIYVMDRYPATKSFKFRWKNHRPSWRYAKKPVFLDLGDVSLVEVMGEKFHAPVWNKDASVRYAVNRARLRGMELQPEEAKRGAMLLQIKTLYENGCGSVALVPKQRLIDQIRL